MRFAGNAPTLAVALAVSSFNAGIAVGFWIAGSAMDPSLGRTRDGVRPYCLLGFA